MTRKQIEAKIAQLEANLKAARNPEALLLHAVPGRLAQDAPGGKITMRQSTTRRINWAQTMIASTRGWRRVYWRLVKRYWELWI